MAGDKPEGMPKKSAEPEEQARRTDSEIEDEPQVFVLSRELTEVYLLLDNLSADPNTTISALAAKHPIDGIAPDRDWLKEICEIRWPPSHSPQVKADQVNLLIRVKDYLNRLAKPASGMSIAFTLMVTQKEGEGQPPADQRDPGVDMKETRWRSSLAEIAYPDLRSRARATRIWLKRLNGLLVAWLIMTCLISWYVAFGNAALGEYASAKDRLQAAQRVVDDLEAGRRRVQGGEGGERSEAGAQAAPAPGAAQKAEPEVGYCQRWRLVQPVAAVNGDILRRYESAEQLQACRELQESQNQLVLAEKRLSRWLGPWKWLQGIGKQPGDAAAAAARLANIIGTAVLPVFYGLLGAAASVLRSLSQKIKTSTLSPRDRSLSLQQLALGAVVGACIGLFIVGGDRTLIGPVTLSGSAISFIAGFGVEAVFQALEALISRIFNIAPAGGGRSAVEETRGRS